MVFSMHELEIMEWSGMESEGIESSGRKMKLLILRCGNKWKGMGVCGREVRRSSIYR